MLHEDLNLRSLKHIEIPFSIEETLISSSNETNPNNETVQCTPQTQNGISFITTFYSNSETV